MTETPRHTPVWMTAAAATVAFLLLNNQIGLVYSAGLNGSFRRLLPRLSILSFQASTKNRYPLPQVRRSVVADGQAM